MNHRRFPLISSALLAVLMCTAAVHSASARPALGAGVATGQEEGQQWQIRVADKRLDLTFSRWAERAGYAVRWDADRYVLVGADVTLTGTFAQAVEQTLESPGVRFSAYPLEACIYANQPPLLRVTRLGDQTQECQQ